MTSVRTFAVNSNNDIYIDMMGNLAITTGLPAVQQVCQQAARTILGEMVLNTDAGIPYFETVFNGVPNLQQFDAALRTAWLAIPSVIEVVSLTFDQVANPQDGNRNSKLTYTATINTTFGSGVING